MLKNLLFVGMVAAVAAPAAAITVTIDGVSSPTLLSDAVDTCMSAGVGPHTINITTDALTTPDRQVFINQPITINGDADANGTACDVLVDIIGISTAADVGINQFKSYIEVQATGNVVINNLKIHPNADGPYIAAANSAAQNVSGIRFFKPVNSSDVSNYNLTKVWVSGSNANGTFATLADGSDLYNAGTFRWSGLNGSTEANFVVHGAVQYSDNAVGAGTINSVLDHCQAGLSRGVALHVTGANTNVTILGGVYGHCQRDGIRIAASASATIKGTVTDRVRVVRSTNTTAGNSHAIEVTGLATVPLIEYVDAASIQSANLFSLRDGTINEVNYVRGLGKFASTGSQVAPVNEPLFIAAAANDLDLIHNSTFHAEAANVANITSVVVNPIELRDNIFTASAPTSMILIGSTTAGVATFDNCAITTDGATNESLSPTPFSGAGAVSPSLTVNNSVSASPQYLLTLADYDWSDNQGASNPLNGAGNRNVLRPAITNVAYLTSSSTGGRLTGGAGPDLAGIDDWMMME